MNFTINRSAFISQLNNVLRAISSKTTIPILTGLKMVVNEDNIVLTGSNSDITIESVISANDTNNDLTIEDTGAIVLPARFFSDIVKLSSKLMAKMLKTFHIFQKLKLINQ